MAAWNLYANLVVFSFIFVAFCPKSKKRRKWITLFVVFEASQNSSVANLIIIATLSPFHLLFATFLSTWHPSLYPLGGISVPHGPILKIPTLFCHFVGWQTILDMTQSDLRIAEERLRRCFLLNVKLKLNFGKSICIEKVQQKKWNVVFRSESCTCWITESPFYVVTWKIWPINQWNRFNPDKKLDYMSFSRLDDLLYQSVLKWFQLKLIFDPHANINKGGLSVWVCFCLPEVVHKKNRKDWGCNTGLSITQMNYKLPSSNIP